MDESIIDKLFSVAAAAWTATALLAVRLFHTWPLVMERLNERKRDVATEKAGDWARLRDEIDRLATRIEALEKKVEECEAERERERKRANAAEAEVTRLEAYHQGLGEAAQEAQAYLSAEREGDRKARDGGDI